MNKVQLTGRIASEIDMRSTASGVSVCSFRVAVNRRFKNADGQYEADFISCVAWRGTADFIAKHLKKGDGIEIVGIIQTRNYENREGNKVFITEVVCEEVGFGVGGSKKEAKDEEIGAHALGEDIDTTGFMAMGPADGDLPF